VKLKFQRLLEEEGFGEGELQQALVHYPLTGGDPEALETLDRYAKKKPVGLERLSLSEMIEIVSSGEARQSRLDSHLVSAGEGG
jgi:hypothetical protein